MTAKSHGRSGRPWRRLRLQILERDGYLCMIRGPKCTKLATTVDHIVALVHAPHLAHEPSNLRAACKSCNSRLGQQITSDRLRAKGQQTPPWVKRRPPFTRPDWGGRPER